MFNNAAYLDFPCEPGKGNTGPNKDAYHPNIRGTRIVRKNKAMKYILKHDSDPLCYKMDPHAEEGLRAQHKRIVYQELMDGTRSLLDTVTDNPEMFPHL